jgi:chromosome segregation ATPase
LETLTATQSADIARLKTAVQDLEAELAAANARIDDAEDRIAALEGKVSALEIAKQNLDAAVAALNAAINNKADTATLNQKVTDLIAAIAAAEDAAKTYADGKDTALQTQLTAAIVTAKGEAITAAEDLVNTAKAELQTAINNKADIATLNAKVAELNAAIATAEATAKAYTDSAVTTLNAAIITAKDEAVDAAKDLVDAAKAQLQAAIDNKADTAAVNAAIANLQNAITALQNAKDNYIAADAALKAELEDAIAKAKQEAIDAAKGHIPYIGTNGNWWIGDTDTGVDANGIKGDTGNGIKEITTSKVNVSDIINNLTSNVTNKPLSAAQGVALKALIDYAFYDLSLDGLELYVFDFNPRGIHCYKKVGFNILGVGRADDEIHMRINK